MPLPWHSRPVVAVVTIALDAMFVLLVEPVPPLPAATPSPGVLGPGAELMSFLSSDLAVDLVPFAGTLVFLAWGLAAVTAGRRVARELGGDTRMHFPAWGLRAWIQRMQEPTLTARQVVWFGWALVVISPLFPIVLQWNFVSPWARARRANSACIHLVTDAELRTASGIPSLERTRLSDEGDRCWAFYGYRRRPDDPMRAVVTVSVRPATFPGPFLGQSTLAQVAADLAKQGYTVEPLPDLGDEAFVARKRSDVIAFEGYGAPVEIEIDESEVDSVDVVDKVVEHLAERRALLKPYARR